MGRTFGKAPAVDLTFKEGFFFLLLASGVL